jgi:glycosyltransferase involved in cell wall biosynthesis
MTHEQVLTHLVVADVFVLNTDYEGLSHQLLEAMALGVPIVTTPVGGNIELIADEINGLLVPYNDVAALSEAACRYLGDQGFAIKMAQKSKEQVGEFSDEKMIGGLLQIMQKL